ncbi:uncharacterized protein K452DRAFT_219743 [Aplosporella prunicola CBS 121167]|uniref:Tubby C-terminal domain-containing protein n=1 Tax=Aplosporella prunicola CBS 121167 TaxID=1176127 RepID=A0A6A6BU43_9PEZI|nr:uncharacterized protein K452DRAFT_219743 [Aplosporella prunicola CBS 121167]KAF2146151.1 hypothetical protein K452DRAFT_219743 [Aplosporella prunicola CBS 121167]
MLQPAPRPIGLFPAHFARQPEAMVVKEHLVPMAQNDYTIKSVEGQTMFYIEAKSFSLSRRKAFMDLQGNILFTIRKENFSIPPCYYAEDSSGKRILEVQSKFTFGSSKAVCSFIGVSGKRESLFMKGNFTASKATITDESTNAPVAMINRDIFTAREIFAGVQTYVVSVAPNVDKALIAAMCICLDERRDERRN